MKTWRLSYMVYLLGGLFASPASAARGNPIEKIIGLLTRLQGQLVEDQETEAAAYKNYHAYCDDSAFNKKEEIRAAASEKELLTAEIAKSQSDITTCIGNIEDASAGVASNEAKAKRASQIRAKDASTFKAAETELMSSIDMLGRAIDILTREMAKTNSAALLQTSEATQQLENVVMGLSAVIDGATLGASEDLAKLTAMLQAHQDSQEGSEDGDAQDQTPRKAYAGKSGGIIEVLDDLRNKAEGQLRDLRNGEAKSIQNHELMISALDDETAQYNKELNEEKAGKSAAQKAKATAEGDLAITTKELAQGQQVLSGIQRDCMRKASDHEATVAGRTAELQALAEAKKIIQAQMGNAAMSAASLQQTNDEEEPSFLQMSMSSAHRLQREQIAGDRVVALVQRLAAEQNSDSLKQLASRISAVIKYGLNGSSKRDPFTKVKGLLRDMIRKLTREQRGDANEKDYCDREMKRTQSKQDELTDDSDSLKTKIDQAASASTKLKSQVKDLQFELTTLAKLNKEMSRARNEEHQVFLRDKGDLSSGLSAMRSAIHVLRDFYAADKEDSSLIQTKAQTETEDTDTDSESEEDTDDMQQPQPPVRHQKSGGAGTGIIGLLEVVESKLAKNLAELQTEEDDAVSAFNKEVQAGKVSKAEKDQDVAYKTREYTALDKSVAELTSDRATTNEELSAVREYFAKVKDRCVAKPDNYEDRKARREKEIRGLEEAKAVLDSQTASLRR